MRRQGFPSKLRISKICTLFCGVSFAHWAFRIQYLQVKPQLLLVFIDLKINQAYSVF